MIKEHEHIFDEIYIAHFENIKNFCKSRLNNDANIAEDITQLSFFILYVKWDTLNSHTEKVLLAWLYKTAKNITKNHIKKSQRDTTVSLDEYLEKGYEIADETYFVDDITYQAYREALERELSSDELKLLNYVLNENFSLHEIAIILDKNVSTVKSRWLRLRKKIQQIIKNI